MAIRPFRFWCQKVIPLIYDDSLSYYELLCKVVHKLNEVIGNENELSENFKRLKEYVDNYFSSLDFQQAVDNKLDEMVEDGTLSSIINEQIFNSLMSKDQNFRGAQTSNYVVNDMINVALTYVANTNKLVYGNSTALNDTMGEQEGKYEIDCSTLCCLVLNGVPYDKSRYALGGDKYNNIPDRVWAQNLYDDGSQNFKRYANMLANTFWDNGHLFNTNKDFSNIRTGDIIFWVGKDVPGSFRNVSHCAIFLNKTATNSLRVIESNTNENAVRIATYTLTDTLYQTIAYAGRPEFNGVEYSWYKNLVIGNQQKVLSTEDTIYYSLESINEGFYTVMIKGTGTARPTITIADASITSYYIGDNIYIAYLRVGTPTNTQIKVRISANYTFNLQWIAVMYRFVAYPVPFYIAPKVTGVYVKADGNKSATSTFSLMELSNMVGSNYQNAFHLANDNTITAEEAGKYLVSIICNIESKASARVVTYKKGSGDPAPINVASKSATSASDSITLTTIVNLSAGDRIGFQVQGTGNANGTIIVVRI